MFLRQKYTTSQPPRLAMVICACNEERFLAAHLLYHHLLGVSRAWLYLDSCSDQTAEIAAQFPWVEILEIDPHERSAFDFVSDLHVVCANHALQLAREEGYDWLLLIDPDEFAFANNPNQADLLWRGNLLAMLREVPPHFQMVKLKTKEVIPAHLSSNAPFWCQCYVSEEENLPHLIRSTLTGKVARWDGSLGHREGKSIVRTCADVQAYDSHRWIWNQDVHFPNRPEYLPLPTLEIGCHYHFVITSFEHWKEKYRKFASVPDTWPCGTPVELPKQWWKEATRSLSEQELNEYYPRWVAKDPHELKQRKEAQEDHVVEEILRAGDCLVGQSLQLPSTGKSRSPKRIQLLDVPPGGVQLEYLPAGMGPNKVWGFHPVEKENGRHFRWTEPEAGMLLQLPPDDYQIRIQCDPVHGRRNRQMRLFLNGRKIARHRGRSEAGELHYSIRGGDFQNGPEYWLTLKCHPLDTSGWPNEQRQLGIPILSITFEPKQKRQAA